jgi:hypothetical protein
MACPLRKYLAFVSFLAACIAGVMAYVRNRGPVGYEEADDGKERKTR